MIKWTFYFDEGNIITEMKNEEEDQHITELVQTKSIIFIPGDKLDIYVNMQMVKCATREIVQATQQTEEVNNEVPADLHPQGSQV